MRPEKPSIVEDLRAQIDSSPFLILVDYSGLNVQQFSELRSRLGDTAAQCRVIKNSFLKRAAKESGLPDISASLEGQSAMVTGEKDVCAAARVLKTFAAEFTKPAVKVGILDGRILSADEIKALADLPPREILLSRLLGVLQAPASKLLRTLNEPAAQFARLLQAKSEK